AGFAALFGQGGGAARLLDVVRPLARFVRGLPDHVGKTRRLSAAAQGALRAIREARRPDRLLFVDLPAALGGPPVPAEGAAAPGAVEALLGALRSALGELQQAYPRLLAEVEEMLAAAFPGAGRTRRRLREAAGPLLGLAVAPALKGFLLRAADEDGDD